MKSYDIKNGKIDYIDQYFKDIYNGSDVLVVGTSTIYNIIVYDRKQDKYMSEYECIKLTAEENFERACKIANEKYNLIPVTDKERALEYSDADINPTTGRNRMGCSENWYDAFYAMKETFTREEIEAMSDNEINNLLRLANNIQMGLY